MFGICSSEGNSGHKGLRKSLRIDGGSIQQKSIPYNGAMLFKKERIYLDYASATPVSRAARTAFLKSQALYGNPGGLHAEGVIAKQSLSKSRVQIASCLGCKAGEVVFTSGGTEGNNLAILGVAQKMIQGGQDMTKTHWIVSSIEHDSILSTFGEVERLGGAVSFVEPDADGVIAPTQVKMLLRPKTVFVSVGWANSEIGVVQPIAKIAKVIREYEAAQKTRILLHSDAGQAPLYEKTTTHSLDVDLLTLDSGKLYGPRGIGALYVKLGTPISSILFGGKQESGMRPGTENVALAASFAASFAWVTSIRNSEEIRLRKMRDALYSTLSKQIPTLVLNGNIEGLLPHMLNVSIPGLSVEYFVLALDSAGIASSTKSACREGEEAQSHVVQALGALKNGERHISAEDRSEHTIRLSLGVETTARDCARAASTFVDVYSRMSTML
ncbi:MAG: hypothetical protein JWO50_552 [Candidatus Kaiserbacteria bacterium]|nr:hypothetical protein [Candidatus Kaiserbacteria bacterium]